MDFNEVVFGRRSVRSFKTEAIASDLIEALITTAIEAPSAMNAQSWIFSVIQEKALIDQISDASKTILLGAGAAEENGRFRTMLADPNFNIFYNAPVLIIISARNGGPWAVANCAVAAQNLMLTAYDLGLGSCWIGFAQSFLQTAAGRALIGVGADDLPVAAIIIGHPHGASPAPARRPADIRWIDAKTVGLRARATDQGLR
jgi:nitroreductase